MNLVAAFFGEHIISLHRDGLPNGVIRDVWRTYRAEDRWAMDQVRCGGSNSHLASHLDVEIIRYQCLINLARKRFVLLEQSIQRAIMDYPRCAGSSVRPMLTWKFGSG